MSIAVVKKGEQLPGGSFFCFLKKEQIFLTLPQHSRFSYRFDLNSQVFKLDYVMLSIVILCIGSAFLYKLINLIEKKFG